MGESPGGGNIEENQRTIAQNNQNSCDMISVRDPSSVKGQVREIFSTFDSIFSVTENWVEPKPIIREDWDSSTVCVWVSHGIAFTLRLGKIRLVTRGNPQSVKKLYLMYELLVIYLPGWLTLYCKYIMFYIRRRRISRFLSKQIFVESLALRQMSRIPPANLQTLHLSPWSKCQANLQLCSIINMYIKIIFIVIFVLPIFQQMWGWFCWWLSWPFKDVCHLYIVL